MTVSTLLFIVGVAAGASGFGIFWLIVAPRKQTRVIATAFTLDRDGAQYVKFDQSLPKREAELAFIEWFGSLQDPYLVAYSEQREP